MSDRRIAKLFQNGGSQAVRLPADFRFDGEEVYVSRDVHTGDIVLSSRSGGTTWDELFALFDGIEVPADFMSDRPDNVIPDDEGRFDDRRAGTGRASNASR